MFPLPSTRIQPSGQRVLSATTTGATWYCRDGLPVEIWHATCTYGTETFRVFIDGRFVGGWARQDLATAYAEQF